MKKKILVTGASGFIGSNTLDILVQSGYEVHAISSKEIVKRYNSITWYKADLLNLTQVEDLLKKVKPKYLLHLAWNVTPGKYVYSHENLIWVQTSIELVRSFKKYGGERAVFAGTCFEYDLRYGYLNEALTPIKPSSLYGTCKASLHNIIEHYCSINNLSFSWPRIFYSYGPNENYKRIVPYVINQLLKGEVAKVSHGNQVRDFLYVYDIANALVNIVESNIQGVVNIGSGKSIMLKEIFMKIGEKIGRPELISLGEVKPSKNEPLMIVADNKRLINEVGWTQYNDLDKGLDQTIQWWKQRKQRS